MTQQNRNSLNNLAKQSANARAQGVRAFTSRLNCLSDIVTERKAAFIPMGDLPSKVRSFYETDGWIPDAQDRASMKITKNIIYAKHTENATLLERLNELLEDIKKPRSTRLIFDQQEQEIQKLENKIRNLCAENLRIEMKYQRIIDDLRRDLEVSETNKNRYKQLLENNSAVIPFPKR